MHDDGNIRYANYQSEEQVRDYLTANGYDESTFGDWFGGAAGQEADTSSDKGPDVSLDLSGKEALGGAEDSSAIAELFGSIVRGELVELSQTATLDPLEASMTPEMILFAPQLQPVEEFYG